ncbi:MAG: tetratricopeptide repeat protein [Calothrix sp. SM1_5_4]|nr:tetratricopeptide repeat protein [Calothrix sp. SM1_5_4]
MGNTKGTIAEMNKVLELDKDHVQALNYLAYTYAEMGSNLEEAFEFANRALKLQPQDGYILDTLGWIHFKRGEIESAIKYLEAAFKIRPDEAIIAEHLGDAYLRHQMWQKAQTMYQRPPRWKATASGTGRFRTRSPISIRRARVFARRPVWTGPVPNSRCPWPFDLPSSPGI